MPNDENNSEEERFARQDQQAYSGWSSLITLAIIRCGNWHFLFDVFQALKNGPSFVAGAANAQYDF
jgi:hypothetical protein